MSSFHPSSSKPEQASTYETVFTIAKAGMGAVDLDKVKAVVYEMSKNSAHFQNEQRKMQQTENKIAKMRAIANKLTQLELHAKAAVIDARIAELEASRDLTRTWIHVDMDAFFASCEELDNPSLKDKPFAVGGVGMISTANYISRSFGVRSAMPGFIALKLCPDLIFVRPNFEKYKAASDKTREVFAMYDPNFKAMSLDEAYLDVTEVCMQRNKSGEEIAEEIRATVEQKTGGLTCSCGVAPNKMLAKICSDKNKPNGQFVLEPSREHVLKFISDLSVRKIPGIGRVTETVLRAFDVHTCSDIITHRALLAALFSPLSMDFFLHCALGLGETRHDKSRGEEEGNGVGAHYGLSRKGLSTEQTFKPLSARTDLEAKCKELAETLAQDMAEENLRGKTVTLKLKLTTFEVRTRAMTLNQYASTSEDILAAALKLLRAELPVEIRLMGLRMSNFYEEPKREQGQKSLIELFGVKNKDKDGTHKNDDHDVVHTSQVFSAGDEVELSLREWQNDGVTDRHTGSHPLSNTLSVKKEEKKYNDGDDDHTAIKTWECQVCTFINHRKSLLCEVCGTSKSGLRRPTTIQQHEEESTKTSLQKGNTLSILDFFPSHDGKKAKRQKR